MLSGPLLADYCPTRVLSNPGRRRHGQESETRPVYLKILDSRGKINSKIFHRNSIVPASSRRQKWIDMLKYNSSCTGGSLRSMWRSQELHLPTVSAVGRFFFQDPPMTPSQFPKFPSHRSFEALRSAGRR